MLLLKSKSSCMHIILTKLIIIQFVKFTSLGHDERRFLRVGRVRTKLTQKKRIKMDITLWNGGIRFNYLNRRLDMIYTYTDMVTS